MDFPQQDFDYYQRTVQMMYQKYFNKRIAIASFALVIIVGYTAIMRDNYLVNGLIGVVLGALIVYLITQRQQFPQVYSGFLQENSPAAKIDHVEEDEYSYNVYRNGIKIARTHL